MRSAAARLFVRANAGGRTLTGGTCEGPNPIPAFAARCASAAGKSTNIEQVLLQDRFGGNGPLLAGALARLDLPTTFIGAIADPNVPASIRSGMTR